MACAKTGEDERASSVSRRSGRERERDGSEASEVHEARTYVERAECGRSVA